MSVQLNKQDEQNKTKNVLITTTKVNSILQTCLLIYVSMGSSPSYLLLSLEYLSICMGHIMALSVSGCACLNACECTMHAWNNVPPGIFLQQIEMKHHFSPLR